MAAALSAVLGYLIGAKSAPKNKNIAELNKHYESVIQSYRAEINRLRGQVTYYKQGKIDGDLAEAGSPEELISGILGVLPPNLKGLVRPFEGQILAYAKSNPEVVDQITEFVKSKTKTRGSGDSDEPASGQTDEAV